LGLSILIVRPISKPNSVGGRGVSIAEVISTLRSVNNISLISNTKSNLALKKPTLLNGKNSGSLNSIALSLLNSSQLLDGHSLAIAFLGEF
jgi:hypothetical protein